MGLNNLETDIENVKRTAQRAISHKRSASTLGYYKDDYIKYFSPFEKQFTTFTICYALRVLVCRLFIERFMKLFPAHTVQFVNLGAGLDTVSFWLLKNFKNVVCYETDFEAQLRLKSDVMYNNYSFKRLLPDMRLVDGLVESDRYKMVPFDLTKIDEFDRLLKSGLSRDLPTVFLSELVFLYIDIELANKFIGFLSEFVNKDSILLFVDHLFRVSPFGKYMRNFLLSLKVDICDMERYTTLESQVERFTNQHWRSKVLCFNNFFNNNMEELERKRIMELEDFKDFKELGIWSSHLLVGLCYKEELKLSKVLNLFDKKNERSSNDSGKYIIPFENHKDLTEEIDKNYFNNLFIGNHKGSEFLDSNNAHILFDEFVGRK